MMGGGYGGCGMMGGGYGSCGMMGGHGMMGGYGQGPMMGYGPGYYGNLPNLNLTVDNLTNRDYWETQNYFESRLAGSDARQRLDRGLAGGVQHPE